MKKIFALMLVCGLILSLSGCFAEGISFCYTESATQDGFTLATNKMANCCFAGEYTCAEYTEGMQITIPDEYNGVPVTRLGGYFGRGLPTPFYIDVDMRVSESDPYPDGHPATYYADSLPAGCKTEELLFNLYIGKNLKTIVFVDMDNYRPFYNEAGEVIYYHPVVNVTCSEENPNFYAADGRLYYKENHALVTDFAYADPEQTFTKTQHGTFLNEAGEEYVYLAHEPDLYCFGSVYDGDLAFEGSVSGEEKTDSNGILTCRTGFYSVKGDAEKNLLARIVPRNEWLHFYRKASLPAFDPSVDNCVRLEWISNHHFVTLTEDGAVHASCGEGITDQAIIAEFLSDIRSQPSPQEAGLYDLVRGPDGKYENCVIDRAIFGYYAEDPNVVYVMEITSFNDLAYSISIDNQAYVLPQKWIQRIYDASDADQTIRSGKFELTGEFDEGLTPYVWLSKQDNSVSIGSGSVISFAANGTFAIEDNTLVAETQVGTFVFEIKNTHTLILTDATDTEFLQFNEGAEFIYSDDM